MTQPIQDSFVLHQGATFARTYRWVRDGVPVNLTGAQIRSQFRLTIGSAVPVLDLTTENGGISIDDAAEGTFTLRASAIKTASIPAGVRRTLVMDVEVVLNGEVTRLIEAEPVLSPEVTR